MVTHLRLWRGQDLWQRREDDVHALLLLQAADEGKQRRVWVNRQAKLGLVVEQERTAEGGRGPVSHEVHCVSWWACVCHTPSPGGIHVHD